MRTSPPVLLSLLSPRYLSPRRSWSLPTRALQLPAPHLQEGPSRTGKAKERTNATKADKIMPKSAQVSPIPPCSRRLTRATECAVPLTPPSPSAHVPPPPSGRRERVDRQGQGNRRRRSSLQGAGPGAHALPSLPAHARGRARGASDTPLPPLTSPLPPQEGGTSGTTGRPRGRPPLSQPDASGTTWRPRGRPPSRSPLPGQKAALNQPGGHPRKVPGAARTRRWWFSRP